MCAWRHPPISASRCLCHATLYVTSTLCNTMLCVTLYNKVTFYCITSNVMTCHSSVGFVFLKCTALLQQLSHLFSSSVDPLLRDQSGYIQHFCTQASSHGSTHCRGMVQLPQCIIARDVLTATAHHFKGYVSRHSASLHAYAEFLH